MPDYDEVDDEVDDRLGLDWSDIAERDYLDERKGGRIEKRPDRKLPKRINGLPTSDVTHCTKLHQLSWQKPSPIANDRVW